jgi:LPS sulfotransferase NodH
MFALLPPTYVMKGYATLLCGFLATAGVSGNPANATKKSSFHKILKKNNFPSFLAVSPSQ